MAKENKVVMWDFDGTLAYSPGLWSVMLMKVMSESLPGQNADREIIRRRLNQGYPWESAERPHPELSSPEKWWAYMEDVIADAYRLAGIPEEYCAMLATEAHRRQVDVSNFTLYDDTISTLKILSSKGCRNIILSNHIPELPDISERLGLKPYIDICLSSANIGYEKPHPVAFSTALKECGNPETVWMVGDNIEADIRGAESLGIPAILVHRDDPGVRYYAETLTDVIDIIEN